MARDWQQEVAQRWNALAGRERLLVGSAGALIVGALIWWLGIAPALLQIRVAREQSPVLEAQLQLMRVQAQEAKSLKAQRVPGYDESLRELEASIKTLGAGASLSVKDARASVSLKAVTGDALAQWLAQVRANARLVPSDLRIQKAPSTGAVAQWDGIVSLNLPAR